MGKGAAQVRPRPQKTLFLGKRWLHGGGGERGKTLPEKGSLTHRRERRGPPPPPFSVKERLSRVWVWEILLMEEESRAQRRRTEETLDPHRRRGKTRHRAKRRRSRRRRDRDRV